jgi:LysR family transcriptional regulator, regulator for metE and metH
MGGIALTKATPLLPPSSHSFQMLQIQHFKALIAISETGNISNAARHLSISQPALSQQIAKLEYLLGTTLFQRNTNPVIFLPPGIRLLESAYEITKSVNNSTRDIAFMTEGTVGKCHLSVECHSSYDWLLPSMAAFQKTWREVQLDLISGYQPDPISLLTKGDADLALVSEMPDRSDVLFYPLFTYQILALLAKSHPLATQPYLNQKDFERQVVAHYPIADERISLFHEFLLPAKINPARRTSEVTEFILHLAESQQAIAPLPSYLTTGYLATHKSVGARPIGENGLFGNLYAVTTVAGGKSPYLMDFIKTLRRICLETMKDVYPLR